MDSNQVGKQMMNFYKTTFDNSYKTMCALQDQAEKTLTALFQQYPWFPQDGNKMIVDWIKTYKEKRDMFKAATDENFKKMEEYFTLGEGKKP